MLNFRTASIVTILLAAAVFLLAIAWPPAVWLLLPLTLAYLSLLVWGAAWIRSGFYIKAFSHGATSEKIVSFTFDDGPDPAATPRILEILRKNEVPAAFFIIGEKAVKNRALLEEIHRGGHLAGIHSYRHGFWFDLYGRKKMERDLEMTAQVIREVTGQKPAWFRPPYGVTNPTVARVARRMNLKVAGWSVRSLDTRIDDPEKLAERVIGRLHPGAVVLMHDNRAVTPKALETIILEAKELGYRFLKIEEMISYVGFTQKAQKGVAKIGKN